MIQWLMKQTGTSVQSQVQGSSVNISKPITRYFDSVTYYITNITWQEHTGNLSPSRRLAINVVYDPPAGPSSTRSMRGPSFIISLSTPKGFTWSPFYCLITTRGNDKVDEDINHFNDWSFFIAINSTTEELDGRAVSALSVWTRKLSNDRRSQSLDGWPKFIISSSSVLRKARLAVGPGCICSR
jgi:hypothetical protein